MSRHTLFLLALLVRTIAIGQDRPVYSRVVIGLHEPDHGARSLAALGIPLDHFVLGPNGYTVELSGHDIDRVRANGFDLDVLIGDMSAYYRQQSTSTPTDGRALGWLCDGPTTFPVPAHFQTGSMAGYLLWEEMLANLDSMVALYPNLISAKEAIGYSLENRPIHFVRISNAPNTDQTDKPEVFYDAVHHAREPASMSQLIFYMWYLLENYGTDPEVTYLVDNREMYFVPCINPDGYVYNQNNDPGGGGMWRKNRRDNGDGTMGVDLNRNYGWLWGFDDQGSSPDGNSETFRGSAPFSEPETQAIRDFCNAHEFRAALNYHCFGDMVINPWGPQPDLLTPDSLLFVAHGNELTRNNGLSRGTCMQVLNYLVNGSSDDWMYGEQTAKPKIQAVTPEVGQADEGFWPPGWRIVPICEENLDMNLVQAHLVGSYAVARDRSRPVFGQLSAEAVFEVQRLGLDPATFTVSIEPLENVVSVAAPKVFDGLELLEARLDSITINLAPSLTDGDPVRYVLAVSNGLFTRRDTVERVFGGAAVAFTDAGSDLSAWSGTSWGTTTEQWHSPPSSVTDSPGGDYAPYEEHFLDLAEPIDLGNALTATLRFWARWNINQIHDLTQVSASADGLNWTPLCGIYTRPGSYFQGNDEPVYEGRQLDWVQEEMSLNDFTGGNTWLRFRILSSMNLTRDGFYFDDLEVITITDATSDINGVADTRSWLRVWPNPAANMAAVRYTGPLSSQARLTLYDAQGATVLENSFRSRTAELELGGLPSGLYTCVLRGTGGPVVTERVMIAR